MAIYAYVKIGNFNYYLNFREPGLSGVYTYEGLMNNATQFYSFQKVIQAVNKIHCQYKIEMMEFFNKKERLRRPKADLTGFL